VFTKKVTVRQNAGKQKGDVPLNHDEEKNGIDTIATEEIVKEIEMPATYNRLGWTPDGHALTFVHNTTGSVQNVYMQPLAGGAPVQLTHFDSEPAFVTSYAWSSDGKKFAITRSRYNDTDVVLFSGFRQTLQK